MGKIYKPELRCDAAFRLVTRILRDELGLPEARVQVNEGGPRGMQVSVFLRAAERPSAPSIEQALAAYLFEARVVVE